MTTFPYPSSYRCDCGYECHFFENTIREMGRISRRKPQFLEEDDHEIEFRGGEAPAWAAARWWTRPKFDCARRAASDDDRSEPLTHRSWSHPGREVGQVFVIIGRPPANG